MLGFIKKGLLVNRILNEKKYKNQIIDNKRIKIILKKLIERVKKKHRPENHKYYLERL